MPPRLRGASATPVTASALVPCPRRTFTSTARRERITKGRFDMYTWLNGAATRTLESGRTDRPSYLGPFLDQPFPANPLFRSQPVLSEATREAIYRKVMEEGGALKAVSEEMGVDVRRVAAVVRLKQVERQWVTQGKKLATPYAKAVMGMLPQTRHVDGQNTHHEPINDIPVHKLSVQQLFVPVSESRHFTREDAAKAFHERLLSADARSPHKELIQMEREVAAAGQGTREESLARFREQAQEQEERFARKLAEERRREQRAIVRERTERFEFRIKQVDASNVGRDGKSHKGVGWRYGAPLQDRKRGMVKIPTSVP